MKKIKNDAIDAFVIAELLASDKYKESYMSTAVLNSAVFRKKYYEL